MFSKRKTNDGGARKASAKPSGRRLFVYFVPIVVVGMLLLALVVLLSQQAVDRSATDAARLSAHSVAEALAARVEGEIVSRRDLLNLALSDGRAANALAAGERAAIDVVERDLQNRLPGLLQARLLRTDVNQPDPSGPAPLGYAGLDMVRRVAESGRPAVAEIHQIKSGAPYLALAMPLSAQGRAVGTVFAAWDMRFLVHVVESSAEFPGRLALLQGDGDAYVLAKGPGTAEVRLNGAMTDVPQSIWKVAYEVRSGRTGLVDPMMLLGVAGGVLVLLLIAVVQWRLLSRDLRTDMTTVVRLAEAIMYRQPAASEPANVSSSSDAITLLTQYVHDARAPGTPTATASSEATQSNDVVTRTVAGVEVDEMDHDPSEVLGGAAQLKPRTDIDVPESLFRAYDVRGVVGDAFNDDFARLLGQAFGSLVREQGGARVAVACDARLSSPALTDAVIDGLTSAGCDVLDIGDAPTPLLYFAMHTEPVQGGVMVTGSHNPRDYNGFKIVIGDKVLDGDDLRALRQRMLDGPLMQGKGSVERARLGDQYVNAVSREVQLTRPLKVVVDAGNGVAGDLAVATFEAMGCDVIPLFCEADGHFPNHHPDPSQPENLSSLILEVQAQNADIGFALDGDGDRLGVVDDAGNIVWADKVLMLLAADVLNRHPGVDVVYDVKSSRHLASFVLGHGGRPIMWKSGHSRMRAKMLETGALLGGEFSGHLFIKERWFGFDDAIYAAVRVLEIMALEARAASVLFADLPGSPSTPEYQLPLDEGQSREIMRALDAHKVFDDARLVELDGLRVEFANGWGLIRPSNTVPSLTFRFEADDEGALAQIKAQFRDLLKRVAPDMQAPF